jgi:hypothetical protein
MIGGAVLGVLLLGFLVMNVLSGGDDEGAIPTLPPITVSPEPGQGGGGGGSPSPTGGVSPIPVFTGRDPFSVPPGLSPTQTATVTTSVSGSVTVTVTTTPPPTSTSTTTTTASPTQPGGGSSEVVGGKMVVLLSVFTSGGEPRVQVEVDGRVFNDIAIGETFDGGRYELASVSGNCATFLYGDESFTLCANSTK